MRLRRLLVVKEAVDLASLQGELPEALNDLPENAILASKRGPFDPMEKALHEAGDRLLQETEHLHPAWSMAKEYPLSP